MRCNARRDLQSLYKKCLKRSHKRSHRDKSTERVDLLLVISMYLAFLKTTMGGRVYKGIKPEL